MRSCEFVRLKMLRPSELLSSILILIHTNTLRQFDILIQHSFIILRYIFSSSPLWIAFVFYNSCFRERNWFYRKMERKRNRNDVILLHLRQLVFLWNRRFLFLLYPFLIKIMKIRPVNWSSIRVTSSCLDKHLLD